MKYSNVLCVYRLICSDVMARGMDIEDVCKYHSLSFTHTSQCSNEHSYMITDHSLTHSLSWLAATQTTCALTYPSLSSGANVPMDAAI